MQVLVILVPVLFGFIGFAVDLARIYLIRMELQTAANAAALAAAARLIGTDAGTTQATDQARLSLDATAGPGNRYNFGSTNIGDTSGFLSSEVSAPRFYDTRANAIGTTAGGEVAGSTARYARITITADAPLLFFGFLPIAQDRKTPVQVAAVAGVSAPVCTACGTEPIAIPAIDTADTVDFGYVRATRYTLGYQCNGNPTPGGINGTRRIPYILLNRYNDQAALFPDEPSQAYRIGAQGMLPTARPDNIADPSTYNQRACLTLLTDEAIWSNASPQACNAPGAPSPAAAFVCGIYSRFDSSAPHSACANIPQVDAMNALYQADIDITDLDDYAAYTGNGRRLITVAIVADIATQPLQALAFRQFLIEPNPGELANNPADSNARFQVLYVGYPAPIRQGRFDGGCQVTAGPGKVVLHQ